jgi:23S rRNA (guanosine2251-2'-O)-methyltransferase
MKRLIVGPRAVAEALRAHANEISIVYVAEEGRRELQELAELAQQRKVVLETRAPAELERLAKGQKHQGVVAIAGSYSYLSFEELMAQMPQRPLLVALDEITDPHNFGAIVRSAVALGAHGIITLKHRAAPVTPVVVRASAGATEHARIARVANLSQTLEALREREYEVLGLAAEGADDLHTLRPSQSGRVLVVGSEGRGLRRLVREHCTQLVRIPMPGPIASLNASVAAAIALYALQTHENAAAVTAEERATAPVR